MALPPGFQFSQASLQDFTDCPRRFQLRWLLNLSWPAVESEPALENESWVHKGQRFHRMVQQHQLGLPPDRLANVLDDPDLSIWWENYLSSGLDLAAGAARILAETALSAPLAGCRLVAKYDALVLYPPGERGGRARILDWKTSRRHPGRPWLAGRLQTRVYPYLLCRAGAALTSGPSLQPEQVDMVYWFSAYPDEPVIFPYSTARYHQDEAFLLDLVGRIETLETAAFSLAGDPSACRFCTYRSLCDRGVQAGCPDEEGLPDETAAGQPFDLELDLDFEQIAEIKF